MHASTKMEATAVTDDALDALEDMGDLRPPFSNPTSFPYTSWSVRDVDSQSRPTPRDPSTLSRRLLDETPTTTPASLPTPNQDLLSLHAPRADGGTEYAPPVNELAVLSNRPMPSAMWDDPDALLGSNGATWVSRPSLCQAPGAPMLKDLDSFTEGTAIGSFDFSLPESGDVPHYEHEPPRSLAFSPDDPTRSIETWRDDVVMSINTRENHFPEEGSTHDPRDQPRGLKRHRSLAFSDGGYDEEEQARSTECGSHGRPLTRRFNECYRDAHTASNNGLPWLREATRCDDGAVIAQRPSSTPPSM